MFAAALSHVRRFGGVMEHPGAVFLAGIGLDLCPTSHPEADGTSDWSGRVDVPCGAAQLWPPSEKADVALRHRLRSSLTHMRRWPGTRAIPYGRRRERSGK